MSVSFNRRSNIADTSGGYKYIPDGRNGAGIPEVGADEFAPADHGHGRGRTGQLGRRPVTPQLLVRLQWQDKKDRVLFSTSKLTNGRMTFKPASSKTGIGIKTAHYCFGNSDSTRETRGGVFCILISCVSKWTGLHHTSFMKITQKILFQNSPIFRNFGSYNIHSQLSSLKPNTAASRLGRNSIYQVFKFQWPRSATTATERLVKEVVIRSIA